LASDFENGDTVDGVVLATNDRILIKNQAAPAENGIYTVNASGAPTRATDADTWAELVGAFVFVTEGTANAATQWVCNVAAGGTINVTAVTFVQFGAQISYTADNEGVQLVGSEFSLQIDGTTLSQSGSGVTVAAGGITNTQVNASAAIAASKLAALTASRAVVSDGSGFISAATTTATEIGYVNGVTSAIQTQLDAKIAASVMTTNNDMIYRAAGVPARLAAGTDGYALQSNSGVPTWTDRKASGIAIVNNSAAYAVGTTFAAMILTTTDSTWGSPPVKSSNTLTFAYTGMHTCLVYLGRATSSNNRRVMVRMRNTTDGSTPTGGASVASVAHSDGAGIALQMTFNVADISKVYEVQICASGSGVTLDADSINSVTANTFQIIIYRQFQ
jgi:hypothetical protein